MSVSIYQSKRGNIREELYLRQLKPQIVVCYFRRHLYICIYVIYKTMFLSDNYNWYIEGKTGGISKHVNQGLSYYMH
jgi:hypothetical protein